MPHHQASSSGMKQKGVQEHHEDALGVALQQEKKIYSLATTDHQLKSWPKTHKQLLCNNDPVYVMRFFSQLYYTVNWGSSL